MNKQLFLGKSLLSNDNILIDQSVLLKHVMVLGASGSGKTFLSKVIVEEAIRNQIPVIAIDSQGDLASLAIPADPDDLATHGVYAGVAMSYSSSLDIKIWTPGTSQGLQISMQPCMYVEDSLGPEDMIRAVHALGMELSNFAGFGDEATAAGLARVVSYCHIYGIVLEDLTDLCEVLKDPPVALEDELEIIFPAAERKKVLRSLIIKMNGPRQLMLAGAPINVDTLFGYEEGGAYDQKKVRISVICLNALTSMEDKQLFVAGLARAVYTWMLQDPKSKPAGLFFLDECAPFLPPVRKPASKEPLLLLLRQARKYGVGMVLATQSPGDVDYTGLGQIGTKLLGRMTQRQEADKVAPLLKDTPNGFDLIEKLPGLKQGEFIAVCPDMFTEPVMFKSRYLVTKHQTLSLEQISDLVTDEDRRIYG